MGLSHGPLPNWARSAGRVAAVSHTPLRPVRMDDELWETFGDAAGDRQRSEVVRNFLRWYVGEDDARQPRRPTTGTDAPPQP